MFVCAFMCVSMYMWLYESACVYVCLYVSVFVCVCAHVCACMHTCMHACACVFSTTTSTGYIQLQEPAVNCGRNSQYLQWLAIGFKQLLAEVKQLLLTFTAASWFSCYYIYSSCGFSFNNWLCSYSLHIASSCNCNSLLAISCNCTPVAFSCISY